MLQESPLYAYFQARDLDRARRFWEDKLGFAPKSADNGGVTYAFANGTAAFVYPTGNTGTFKASQAFWSVEDVDREMAELKKRGVEFEHDDVPGERSPEGAITAGGAKAASFKDSEGNTLAIVQDLSHQASSRSASQLP